MQTGWYLFAGFVFLLLIAAMFFYDRLKRSRSSQQEAIRQKEVRLFSLYQNLEDLVNSIEDFVAEAREDIAADRAEIAKALSETAILRAQAEAAAVKAALAAADAPRHALPLVVEDIAPTQVKEADIAPIAKNTPPAPAITAPVRHMPPAKPKQEGKSKPPVTKIKAMRESGLDPDAIAQELSLSRGEVKLILGLSEPSSS